MDYYKTLGIEKNASDDEIKKAYRKLALEFHPDRNQGSTEAEEKFKQINEAYSVLSDQNKRRSYDRFGMRDRTSSQQANYYPNIEEIMGNFGFGGFSVARNPTTPRQGRTVNHVLDVTLSEAVLGTKKEIHMNFPDVCPRCSGSGYDEVDTCNVCNGVGGTVTEAGPNMRSMSICPACRGAGVFPKAVCVQCAGETVVSTERSLVVTVPANAQHGMTLRLVGQGQRGYCGGPPGHLMLMINVRYPKNLTEEQKQFLKRLEY